MKRLLVAWSLSSAAALACASTGPTRELVDARHAYEAARVAPEARYAPERVREAKQALDRAEAAHRERPGSFEEKSLAYVASRRADLAVVYGDYERERRRREAADAAYRAREDEFRQKAESNARETRRVLEGLGTDRGESP